MLLRAQLAKTRDLCHGFNGRKCALRREAKMYLDFLVDIPDVPGKITFRRKKDVEYVYYEYAREYNKETKMTKPKRATIGKRSQDDPLKMQPNQNFLKYFPDAELPEREDRAVRSGCLRIGAWLVIRKVINDYDLPEMLGEYFSYDEVGLILDLASYSVIEENKNAQRYSDYIYDHPLFTEDMEQYSDLAVSDFLHSVTDDQADGFMDLWNEHRDRSEEIYISYSDSANENFQAGDIEMAEHEHPKADTDAPFFNYVLAYDTHNREPLYYEEYLGNVDDVPQLQAMLDKAAGYGYKKIGFILDRGYFSRDNIQYMDKCGYSFVIMAGGMASFVKDLILENRGSFEDTRVNEIGRYDIYGMTVKGRLYESDEKERYFHLYHSAEEENDQRAAVESWISMLKIFLEENENRAYEFGPAFEKYFHLHYDENGVFLFAEENTEVIERELDLAGYFCIITSEQMTAEDAIELYLNRDVDEHLFAVDKTYLGDFDDESIWSDEDMWFLMGEPEDVKIFIEFIALIIRCRIYTCLEDEKKKLGKDLNYMTVSAALNELEKIEMTRQLDNVYRLDHAVTAKQRTILKAFGIDVNHVKHQASVISKELKDN